MDNKTIFKTKKKKHLCHESVTFKRRKSQMYSNVALRQIFLCDTEYENQPLMYISFINSRSSRRQN